jgi:hypothetical protein
VGLMEDTIVHEFYADFKEHPVNLYNYEEVAVLETRAIRIGSTVYIRHLVKEVR